MAGKLPKWKVGQAVAVTPMNRMIDAINAVATIGVTSPLTLQQINGGGILIGCPALPQLDLVTLDEHIKAGKYDKKGLRTVRDYDASGSDAEQFHNDQGDPELQHTMDAWKSVWLEGHRGLALWLPNAGQRIVLPGFNFHIVELTEELTDGGVADAKVLTPITGSLVDTVDPDLDPDPITIEVNDIGTGATTPSGTKCFVNQHQVGGKWWVVPAVAGPGGTGTIKYCYFTADAAFTRDDETFDGTVLRAWGDGTLPTGTIELVNPPSATSLKFWWAAASGQMGRAIWNEQDGTWEVDHMEPVLATPVENVDWTSPLLTQDKRDIWTHFVENPDTTEILEGTTECAPP
jgi:hypothetical protein